MIKDLILFLTLVLSTLNACAFQPQGFFFFGDSLSDSGYQNNNPLVKKSGKTPQWTSPNGHTWVYYFLQNYEQRSSSTNTTLMSNNMDASALFRPIPTHIIPILDGNNFAAGGSTTGSIGIINSKEYKAPSLLNQINYFVNIYAPKHSTNIALNEYLIWSGDNDLIKKLAIEMWFERQLQKWDLSRAAAALHLFDLRKSSTRFTKTENQIAANLLSAVTTLQKAGAEKIIVILLPDIGDSPFISSLTHGLQQKSGSLITSAELSAEMHRVTKNTNALIREKLAHTRAIFIDVNEILQPLISMATPGHFQETPQQFGKQKDFLITNNKGTACRSNQQALTCIPTVANAQHYVFEDLLHPTDQTHQMIGDYVYYQSQQKLGVH
jgi:phospholipase/lecithinase/hemolysin